MRKTLVGSLVCIFAFMLSTAFRAPEIPIIEKANPAASPVLDNACSVNNSTFKDGEKITYKLFYNWKFVWVAAGEVTFTVKDMGNQYYLSCVGRTYKSYDPFFKVRDHYECYIDKNTLLPNVAIRNVAEGKYRLYDKVTYDWENQKVKSLRGKSKETAETTEYPIGDCVHDLLSIVYFSRNIDFDNMQSGEKIPVNLFMDKKTWPLKVTYRGKQEKKRVRRNGKFKTLMFSPQVITGEYFKEGTEMNIYVSDDQNRLPLIIESPLSVGYVKAVVKKYEGLKYDMEADL